MDCWEILGIERFSDKKTIKIAYAKQLKLHRPDEDPEGFQQLHRAYKSALSWVPDVVDESSWMTRDDERSQSSAQSLSNALREALEETSKQESRDLSEGSANIVTVQPTAIIDIDNTQADAKSEPSEEDLLLLEEIHGQEHLLSEDWQKFHHKVSEIVKSNNNCNDLTQWQFLESLSSMNDLEFRKAASDQLFEIVAEVNSVSLDNKHLHIKRPVLNYLNQQFSWDKKWQDYQLVHPRRMLNAVYPYLAESDKPIKGINKKRELYYYRRGAAFAIDLSLLFIPILLYALLKGALVAAGFANWVKQLGIEGETIALIWVAAYLLLIIPIQESSKHQATCGKRLLALQVIDKQGDRIGFFQAFWRGLLTVFCCIGIKVVVFINFALSYWRSEILQDTLSRSYVILRPGSR